VDWLRSLCTGLPSGVGSLRESLRELTRLHADLLVPAASRTAIRSVVVVQSDFGRSLLALVGGSFAASELLGSRLDYGLRWRRGLGELLRLDDAEDLGHLCVPLAHIHAQQSEDPVESLHGVLDVVFGIESILTLQEVERRHRPIDKAALIANGLGNDERHPLAILHLVSRIGSESAVRNDGSRRRNAVHTVRAEFDFFRKDEILR
jgi:hypothetical protein